MSNKCPKNTNQQWVPLPHHQLVTLKEIIHQRSKKKVTVIIDGKPQEMSLADYFDYLYNKWITAKKAWGDKQQRMMDQLKEQYKSPADKWWDEYLVWYEQHAEEYIRHINATYDEIVANFPLTEWESVWTILKTAE